MRFWQAYATAQMAAAAVWADQHATGFWLHAGAQLVAFAGGAFGWWIWKHAFRASSKENGQ